MAKPNYAFEKRQKEIAKKKKKEEKRQQKATADQLKPADAEQTGAENSVPPSTDRP